MGIVVVGALYTATHPAFANRGYKTGRVVVISAYITLISLSTGIVMGLAVLDEPWPSQLGMSLLRILALATTIVGIVMLNWKGLSSSSQGEAGGAALLEAGGVRSDGGGATSTQSG